MSLPIPVHPFQFTHPRGVRLLMLHRLLIILLLFQFTHPRGVRRIGSLISSGKANEFQFTHPRGVRHEDPCRELIKYIVSIHAPTRGATSLCPIVSFGPSGFQFTHPRGVRHLALQLKGRELEFQFTHPRGVRPQLHC